MAPFLGYMGVMASIVFASESSAERNGFVRSEDLVNGKLACSERYYSSRVSSQKISIIDNLSDTTTIDNVQ